MRESGRVERATWTPEDRERERREVSRERAEHLGWTQAKLSM